MTSLRKLELICGVATAVIAMTLSLFVLKFDWDASRIVEKQFFILKELSQVLLLFLFPGLLVAFGSYAHGAKSKPWGKLMLAVGCVAVIGSFFFLFVILPFAKISAWSMLNLSFLLLAILTLVFSFVASKKLNR